MNTDGAVNTGPIAPIVAESAYVHCMGEGIVRTSDGCRVVRFTLSFAQDHVIHPMGDLMTWYLNEREGDPAIAARQSHHRYRAAIWKGTDFEQSGHPDARFISVLDRSHSDPEFGMLTMTKFGASRRENATILRGAMLAAEALNLADFEWEPPT